ncbi:MAG TPA: enoyl-CoA hydratase/isomerase family protein [Povalibacter sp.]|uniref:enoyl-CoA hydratase/isomerase family protein n=1 Tax=Povalibacter sp. TaxID=1962978 RepID=UPI002B515652|nr:enoyl-CoA hydratase/isomerase family protein [Povalibacter sp.]HMN47046.1 enoyl-CoA hydratase/isomerase family protein [Povalibacter sp.]
MIARYLIQPLQAVSSQALALVDLDTWPRDAGLQPLPSVPVIGLGERAHPLAATLDAIIEAPIALETLIRQVEANPHAAAVIVQLLRVAEGQSLDRALTLESLSYGLLQASAEYAQWLAARNHAKVSTVPGSVILDRQDDELRVVLNRPQARNAIDRAMRDQLFEAFTVAALDPDIRAVKFRAVGAAFSAGGDLDEFGTTRDAATAHDIRCRTLPARAIARRPEIVDVHIQGACIGAGLEMAAFAQRVTATKGAWFQLPELSMGLLPGAGGCVSVPRRIGRQRAALMMLSGERVDAATALRWGLIDAITDEAPPVGPASAGLE